MTAGTVVSTPYVPFVKAIPHRFSREHLVLGVETEGSWELLVSARTPQWIPHNIGVELREHAEQREIPADELAVMIDSAYETYEAESRRATAEAQQDTTVAAEDADRDLLALADKGDTAQFVDMVLFQALARGASDVHIQPTADATLVRVRVDGVLIQTHSVGRDAAAAITSRIKVLADLDIAERRIAQDGRASVTLGRKSDSGRSVDLRISTLPTSHGERVVVRLLDTARDAGLQHFDALGMPSAVRESLEQIASSSHGMTLVTGPTGSGKSTTLYATLRWIAAQRSTLNIMTIEDPIECDLSEPGVAVSQAQVSTKKGTTFASGLRHILRQDPDVVMIGEIRDEETARIAVQASLTGHLVFSTLHTNDAASAVTRLTDLSIEPYLVGASLSAVMAQRLVRLVHQDCGGRGCEACLHTGFRGRTGIYELLRIDSDIRELIHAARGHHAIRHLAASRGMRPLTESGAELVASGKTSPAEIERVVSGV